jgi:hypothetical protein
MGFTPILVEAVKEQQKEIDSQAATIENMKEEIRVLTELVNKMSSRMDAMDDSAGGR